MGVSDPDDLEKAVVLNASPRSEPKRGVVLIIADDDELAEGMRIELQAAGFVVHVALSRSEGLRVFRWCGASAVVVDRMADGIDGLMVIETLRGSGDWTPVLAVGEPVSVEERITFFRSGADDYLARPFDLREMTVRLEALLRRCRDSRPPVLGVGAIEMDLVARSVRCMGRRVDLLPREFTLLEYFARRPRQVLSRRQLLDDVWRQKGYASANVVDVQVGHVRRKLDPTGARRFIVNVRGTGFRLDPEGLELESGRSRRTIVSRRRGPWRARYASGYVESTIARFRCAGDRINTEGSRQIAGRSPGADPIGRGNDIAPWRQTGGG